MEFTPWASGDFAIGPAIGRSMRRMLVPNLRTGHGRTCARLCQEVPRASHAKLPRVPLRLPAFVARRSGRRRFGTRRFRNFYMGSIGAALGYTMQATIAAWLMATLTPSALMVALVQTASTAPSLLFGLIAGTLADIVDRRT